MQIKKETHNRQRYSRPNAASNKHRELAVIVSQLIVTTLALSLIALFAAMTGIQSHDFWEVIRAAINLQSILQGLRMLIALSK